MPAKFVHLRLHTAFSLTESTLRIDKLTKLVSGDSQPAAAITDTNNMFGALEFAQSMSAAGVQPIMGAQIELEDKAGLGGCSGATRGMRTQFCIDGCIDWRLPTITMKTLRMPYALSDDEDAI